jgi:hypothetical protein
VQRVLGGNDDKKSDYVDTRKGLDTLSNWGIPEVFREWLEYSVVREPAPVIVRPKDGEIERCGGALERTVLGGEEAEEALHLLRSLVECRGADKAVNIRQQQRVVGTATVAGGLNVRSRRGKHREPVWLCSMSSLSTDCRAEGATRCRDVSNEETFANRADSQVGSAGVSRDSGAERVVGAGERGRDKRGWTCGRRRAVGCG